MLKEIELLEKSAITLIIQGKYNSTNLDNIKYMIDQNVKVIVSTWLGDMIDQDRKSLENAGALVIETPDPGSVISYEVGGQLKTLNVKRVCRGMAEALKFVKTDYVIKSRMDVTFDMDKFLRSWQRTGKNAVSVNVTTHVPERFGSYGYLFLISDWIWGFKLDQIAGTFEVEVEEDDYIMQTPSRIKDMLWHTKLGAEQILALLISGFNPVEYTNFPSNGKSNAYKTLDRKMKSFWGNIDADLIELKSNSYPGVGRTLKWLRYKHPHFDDVGKFVWRPLDLLMFLTGRLVNIFKKII